MVVITKQHIAAAKLAGACDAAKKYRAGTLVKKVSAEHLAWYEARFPEESAAASSKLTEECGLIVDGRLPLWAFGDGDGDGYGDGSGYGSGYGDGYGDGSGYGSGYGDGYGDGSGYGDGYGYGYGYGSGGSQQ